MPVTKNALQKVLDELSLDYANGKYLNNISGNYGLHRPAQGFSDAQWRALSKVLSLQYKQIANKFRDVLEIILGPQFTLVSSFAEDVPAGVKKMVVHDASRFPQVGTMVLDEGLPTAETISYKLIDYPSNTVFFDTKTQYAHKADVYDYETLLIQVAPNLLTVVSSELLPQNFTAGRTYTIIVGKGTPSEEVVVLDGNTDYVYSGDLSITTSLVNEHPITLPSPGVAYLKQPYVGTSYKLVVDNIGLFPESGYLNIPGGEGLIVVEYIYRSVDENVLNLKYSLGLDLPTGAPIEFVPFTGTVALASVQVKGAGWDVIQSTPRNVDILIPGNLGDGQDLRTASYIHVTLDPSTMGTQALASDANPGDTTVDVSSINALWPKSGVVEIKNAFFVSPSDEISAYSVHDGVNTKIPHGIKNLQVSGNSVAFYNANYGPTEGRYDIADGDLYSSQPATFPGPYIYSPDELAPSALGETVTAEALTEGVTYTELDITDASGFSEDGGFAIIDFGMDQRQDISYSGKTGNTLELENTLVPTSSFASGTPIMPSPGPSVPPEEGYGFPLRAPLDPVENLQFIIDLVRAAGVQVQFITHR